MECRVGCAACCVVISISSPIPGMPEGKPAGVRCVQLDERGLCRIFGQPERPKVCDDFKASEEMCGSTDQEAFENLALLEKLTS